MCSTFSSLCFGLPLLTTLSQKSPYCTVARNWQRQQGPGHYSGSHKLFSMSLRINRVNYPLKQTTTKQLFFWETRKTCGFLSLEEARRNYNKALWNFSLMLSDLFQSPDSWLDPLHKSSKSCFWGGESFRDFLEEIWRNNNNKIGRMQFNSISAPFEYSLLYRKHFDKKYYAIF